MSLHPVSAYRVPDHAARVAQAAFPKGTLCLRVYVGNHLYGSGFCGSDRRMILKLPRPTSAARRGWAIKCI